MDPKQARLGAREQETIFHVDVKLGDFLTVRVGQVEFGGG